MPTLWIGFGPVLRTTVTSDPPTLVCLPPEVLSRLSGSPSHNRVRHRASGSAFHFSLADVRRAYYCNSLGMATDWLATLHLLTTAKYTIDVEPFFSHMLCSTPPVVAYDSSPRIADAWARCPEVLDVDTRARHDPAEPREPMGSGLDSVTSDLWTRCLRTILTRT